ncbi:MAG: PQQ-binding-like beta-propeller repeat protein [Deltaproteobacteria bacterium]|nr:PQQ-binding-like beta-propeller repeat protein [Deltaproteobacteria bacterium]
MFFPRLVFFSVVTAALSVGCAGNYRLERGSSEGYDAPREVLHLRWQRRLVHHKLLTYRPQEWASATFVSSANGEGGVEEGTLFIGSSEKHFDAYSRDGKRLWSLPTGGAVSSIPWFNPHNKWVYFGCDDGKLYAVDSETGKIRWSYATKGTIVHPPAYHDGLIVFTSSENRVYGLDAKTGRWRWQYDRALPEGFTIQGYAGVLSHGGVVYTGFGDGVFVALKATTGEVIWTKSLAGDKTRFVDIDTTPILAGGLVLTASYASGLYALDPKTGSVAWSFRQPAIAAVVASPDGLLVVAPRAGIVALDGDGHIRWRQAYRHGVPNTPLIVGPYVIVGGTESNLVVADARTGELLQQFASGAGISAPVARSGDTVAVLSNHGWLYVFDLRL